MCNSYGKMGIIGGTFNPIHNGHLTIASMVRKLFSFDKILFIPSGHPPHKPDSEVINAEHRYEMVRLAIASYSYFEVTRIELDREGHTYTVNTLKELKEKYGQDIGLFFIIGTDVIPQLHTWRDSNSVFRLCEFIAVPRLGFDLKSIESEMELLKRCCDLKISIVQIPLIDISSSEIRTMCKRGESIKHLVPEGVFEYIESQGLYRESQGTNRESQELYRDSKVCTGNRSDEY